MARPPGESSHPDGEDSARFDHADLQAQWADLTARLGPLRLPEADDSPGPHGPQDATPPPGSQDPVLPELGSAVVSGAARPLGPRDYSPEHEETDGDFVPPDPGPIGAPTRNPLPWVGALGGPVAILAMLVFWPAAPPVAYFTAMGVAIAGVIVLWWRLPQRRNEDDDGAVV